VHLLTEILIELGCAGHGGDVRSGGVGGGVGGDPGGSRLQDAAAQEETLEPGGVRRAGGGHPRWRWGGEQRWPVCDDQLNRQLPRRLLWQIG